MSRHDDDVRLGHIFDAVQSLFRWTAHTSQKQFLADDILQAAVAYQIQIIGEAASRLSSGFRTAQVHVPWGDIIKMRHIFVHEYQRVDATVIWQVVIEDLPPLLTQIAE